MGNHHSVPKTISYDEAVVRIGKDLERIEERFHYLASSLNFSKIDFENLFSDNMDFGHLLFYAFCRCPETNYFKNFGKIIKIIFAILQLINQKFKLKNRGRNFI